MNDATPTPAIPGIQPSGAACTHCRSPLTDHYFEANGARLCDPCTASVQQHLTGTGSSVGRFFKATLFGIGAMLVGALAYGLWLGFTNIQFALITIGIGWFVGKAVRHGSGNRGGWRYGVLAVLLTYAAISFSSLGIVLRDLPKSELGPVVDVIAAILMCFAVPVLEATESILSLVITAFGLWQAWTMNRSAQIAISGPHPLTPVAPV